MQHLLRHRLVEPHVSRALLARLVRPSLGFFAQEERGGAVRDYRLAGSDVRVVVQHRTPDVHVLDEVFYAKVYEPPAAVAQALAALGPAPAITDLGANIGMFGAWALQRWPQAAITAFEPDARNASMLRRAVAANGAQDRWQVVQAAAVAQDRSVTFVPGGFATSHVGIAGEAGGVTVDGVDALPAMVACDLLKIDIEGGEWELLADERLAGTRARVVVLEYHPEGCPSGDPEAAAAGLLQGAGFSTVTSMRTSPHHGVLWGTRG